MNRHFPIMSLEPLEAVSLPSGEFLGNVEFENGLVEGFTFFHSSVKNEADAAKLVVEIGDAWRARRA